MVTGVLRDPVQAETEGLGLLMIVYVHDGDKILQN